MQNLSKDELFLISVKLDLPSILKLCMTNKNIRKKIDQNIWNYKIREFDTFLYVKRDDLSRKEQCIMLCKLIMLKNRLNLPQKYIQHI